MLGGDCMSGMPCDCRPKERAAHEHTHLIGLCRVLRKLLARVSGASPSA
jgi:hypothetical protein